MDRTRTTRRGLGWLLPLAALLVCGCQTVRTPEEDIAKRNLPRELSKTSMPDYVVEPPDIIRVEVLQSLPGRPISGEKLVRPDGKISLDFYGDLYVAGLTTSEIKEKVVIHLRKYLRDEVLGLIELDEDDKPRLDKDGKIISKAPGDVNNVFVDVATYNSKVYYVEGDVGLPGRFPITGNETVLDALNYAGGYAPTAATQNVRLVRPAPPDACCAQVLPVNFPAIINAGDTTTNYQLMPGDRLLVYRDPIVRTSVFLNRLAEPFSTVVNQIFTFTLVKRSLSGNLLGGGSSASSAPRVSRLPTTNSPGR